uniref:NADH-ubiquinone oxidoreductase chain 4L n=1 Tax=Aphelocheirus ellipsoideus TaxID=575831 RepID=C5HIG8_9HEMI|nr:NADH dehydrogenase subunit 4L [Aphelocheirus ellipsoideus]
MFYNLSLINFLMYFIMVMFFSGMIVFCSVRKHLLLTLLSLEFLMLILFISFFNYLITFNYESYFSLIFLTFSVCEGALGLSILVSLIRCHGNDNISALALMW